MRPEKTATPGYATQLKRKQSKLHQTILLSTLISMLPAGTAVADEGLGDLEEIVVTALKREGASLVDTAAGIAVVTGSDIEDAGANGLNDFLERTPALSIDPSTTSGFNTFQVRGVSATLGAATVGFYMDDLPFSLSRVNTVPAVSSFDLQQVEVLRGPQGTLYGAGASGGVVVVRTKNPEMNEFGGKVDVSYSSADGGGDAYVTNLAVNIPLVEDVLSARTVVSYQDDEGWIDDSFSGRENVNDSEKLDARIKVLYEPTEKMSLNFLANISRNDSSARGTIADDSMEIFLDGSLWSDIDDSIFEIDYEQYGLTLNYEFENFDLYNSISYINLDRKFTFLPVPLINDMDFSSLINEFRLSSNGDNKLDWLVGVFYRDTENYTYVPLLDAGLGLPNVRDQIDSKQISVFGDATYELMEDKLYLSAGLSYFSDDFDFSIFWDPEAFPFLDRDLSNDTNEVSSQITITYHPSENSTLYARWAQGFRGGVFNTSLGLVQVQLVTGDFTNLGDVDTENISSLEVGYKAEIMGSLAYTELVFFHNKLDNPQLVGTYTVGGNSALAIIEGEEAETSGVEFVLGASPVDNLDLNFTFTYTDAELTKDVYLGTVLQYADGDPMTQVPEIMASSSATYRWELDNGLQASILGTVQYISEKTLAVPQGEDIEGDATTLANIRAEVGTDAWSVYGFINNLSDEDGAITPATPYVAAPPAIFTDGFYASRYKPRTYGLGVRFSF